MKTRTKQLILVILFALFIAFILGYLWYPFPAANQTSASSLEFSKLFTLAYDLV